VPKEPVRARGRERVGRREGRSGVARRNREATGPVREKRGDTLIATLRRTYGEDFAPGVRGNTRLKTLLDRTGNKSLSDYLKAAMPATERGTEHHDDQKLPIIRYASEKRFREAHRKTSLLHGGLFRRLAE
jgi:hypothetical protein